MRFFFNVDNVFVLDKYDVIFFKQIVVLNNEYGRSQKIVKLRRIPIHIIIICIICP